MSGELFTIRTQIYRTPMDEFLLDGHRGRPVLDVYDEISCSEQLNSLAPDGLAEVLTELVADKFRDMLRTEIAEVS